MISTIKKLLGVNIIVQAIGLATYPIILFFYSMDDIALYGLLYGAMSIFSIILSFRIENIFFGISLKKSYALYAFYIKFLFSPMIILSAILFYLSINLISEFYLNFLIAFFAGIFLAAFNVTYNILVRIKNENYNYLKICRCFLELFFVLLGSILNFEMLYIFFLVSLSYLLVSLYSMTLVFFSKYKIKIFKSYLKPIFIDVFSSLLNTSYLYSPNYFLYFGINKELSGYYFIINRFFGVPSIMVAQSLSIALKQYLSGKKSIGYRNTLNNFNKNIYLKVFKFYLLLSFLSVFVFYILDKFRYQSLWYVFLIILPLMIFRFKFIVYSSLFYVLKDYKGNFILQSALFFIASVSFIVGWYLDNSWLSLGVYSILSIFVYQYFLNRVFSRDLDN